MSDSPTPRELAERLRRWYANGEKGLMTLCDTEGAPPAVKEAAQRWYDKGHARIDHIADLIEGL